jgi:ribosomal protein S18 acetylase RimI-like enzyme
MRITVREADGQSLQQVNRFDNVFTVDSHLVLNVENDRISYGFVPVKPYEKRYAIETADYSSYVEDADKTIFFAYVNDELAGQIRVIKWWNRYAYIDDIVVEPKFRGQGVGRALIHRAMDWAKAKKFPGLMLETQNNNGSACRLYESCGFELGGFDRYLYKGINPDTEEIALYWYLLF